VLIGDKISAIHERAGPHFKLLSQVAEMALHTLWSAMGQSLPLAKNPFAWTPDHGRLCA
jgi:hypothetical protein